MIRMVIILELKIQQDHIVEINLIIKKLHILIILINSNSNEELVK